MPQMVCRDLSLGYDKKTVTSGINFEINPGDYICIVGENGSGKSTLMKAILGLLPIQSGSLEIERELKNAIGYLPV